MRHSTSLKTDTFFTTLTTALLMKGIAVVLAPTGGAAYTVTGQGHGQQMAATYDFGTINAADREPHLLAIQEAAMIEQQLVLAAKASQEGTGLKELAGAQQPVVDKKPVKKSSKRPAAKKVPKAKKAPAKKGGRDYQAIAAKAAKTRAANKAKKVKAAKKAEVQPDDSVLS